VARRYGAVTLARAYADFEDHPERVQRDLQISGIGVVSTGPFHGAERSKGGADLEMLTDIFESLLDRPHLAAYLLMTGDRRFIRAVNLIRNRYTKEVVVAGVRGSVSNDLIEAAGGCFEPLEFAPVADGDRRDTFIRFVDRLERSKPFITFKYVAAAMTTSSEFPGLDELEAREFVAEAIQDGILVKHQRPDGYRVLHLNRELQDLDGVLSRPGRPGPADRDDVMTGDLEDPLDEEDYGDLEPPEDRDGPPGSGPEVGQEEAAWQERDDF